MSKWKATKAKRILASLLKIGWNIKREKGSHKVLERPGWNNFVFAFQEREEINPRILSRIAKSRLTPED